MSTNGDPASEQPSDLTGDAGAVPPPYTPPVPPPYAPPAQAPAEPSSASEPQYASDPRYTAAPDYAGAPQYAGEAVSFGVPAAPGWESVTAEPPEPPRRSSKRWGIAIAGVAVLALVGGGGVWAYSFLSGGGAQPDTVVPASAVAYVSVDLDPSAGQKIAAVRFLRKFPALRSDISENGDLLQGLFSTTHPASSSNKIDFARDVKPWIGKRGAVVVLPPAKSGGDVRTVVALQVSDEARARADIPKVLAEGASDWTVFGGVDSSVSCDDSAFPDPSSTSADVTPGVDPSCVSTSDPSTPPGFVVRDGYALIGLDQAGIEKVSADAKAAPLSASPVYKSDMKLITSATIARAWLDLDAIGKLNPAASDVVPYRLVVPPGGREVFGLHVDPGYVELQARGVGGTAAPASTTPGGPLLATLPADTTGAVAFGDAADFAQQYMTSLGQAGGPLGLTEGATLSHLKSLLGSRFVVAVGHVDGGTPQIGVRVDTSDPGGSSAVLDELRAKSQAQADAFNKTLGPQDGPEVPFPVIPPVAHAQSADGIAYGSTQEYATLLAQDGTLGSDPELAKAAPDLSDADVAAYVSFDRIVAQASDPESVKNLAPLAALGMTIRTTGPDASLDVRLLAH